MSILVPAVSPVSMAVARPNVVGPNRPRKIGLIGGAPGSLASAPWADPSWEFWAHASVVMALPWPRIARFFDLHPENCFMEKQKHGLPDYYGFLRRLPTPVYMQAKYPEIPASVAYPLTMMQEQWPDTPFGSLTAYMVALALYEGVTHLGFWGIDYAHNTEYAEQRANAEHWAGIAKGTGVQIVIPKASPFCHEPKLLYAYETHTPELYAQRKARARMAVQPKAFSASTLEPVQGQAGLDDAEALRRRTNPAWAKAMDEMKDEAPVWVPTLGV